MPDTLPVALAITAIGMTLLFLTLALFYGLLALLTAVVRDRRAADHGTPDAAASASAPAPVEDSAARQRAAAIAVALARAEAQAGAAPTLPDLILEDVAAAGGWWALHHGRRLAAPPSPWRGR